MHKYSPPLSQYLVEPPFAAITAASLLGYVSTSFSHPEMEMFVHSSWNKDEAQSDWLETVCEQLFSSLAIDSQLDLDLGFDWAILRH